MDTITPFRLAQTTTFSRWLSGLKDYRAKAAIVLRLKQVAAGHWGDVKNVGGGVSELRWHIGPARPETLPKPKNLPRSTQMSKTTEFDPASYLDSEEVIAEYLNLALASGDTDLLLSAIGDVAKARGMAQIARDTGLGRESLYKALSAGAKPRFDTVFKVLQALGVQMQAHPMPQQP